MHKKNKRKEEFAVWFVAEFTLRHIRHRISSLTWAIREEDCFIRSIKCPIYSKFLQLFNDCSHSLYRVIK